MSGALKLQTVDLLIWQKSDMKNLPSFAGVPAYPMVFTQFQG